MFFCLVKEICIYRILIDVYLNFGWTRVEIVEIRKKRKNWTDIENNK